MLVLSRQLFAEGEQDNCGCQQSLLRNNLGQDYSHGKLTPALIAILSDSVAVCEQCACAEY
jgi:hypothetical protein